MTELWSRWPYLVAIAMLMALSCLFSGSEAALFSLSDRDRRRLRRGGVAARGVTELLSDPQRLLSAILFWNLLVNMVCFSLIAILASHVSRPGLFSGICLLSVIFFSEMLPKSVAVMMPYRISVSVSLPMRVAVAVVRPILPIVKGVNAAASRLLWPSFEPEPELELTDIDRAIELSTDDAVLRRRERETLRSLVSMAEIRVNEVMRPRSKLVVVTPPLTGEILASGIPPGGYLLVADHVDETGQSLVGSIPLSLLRPSQLDDLQESMEDVIYVPWSARVSQVFENLQKSELTVAVIVNEFGEAVGALSVDDILRGVLASSDRQDEPEDQIKQVGGDHYRMTGSTSLRALAKRLSIELPEERAATVAGHLQRHNERVPHVGDVAPLPPYELVVTEENADQLWIEVWRGPEVN